MIPRRRISIRSDDLTEWIKTVCGKRHSPEDDVSEFERAFADYLGSNFARATASGRDALELAFDAVGAVSGDEVIIPAYTLGELLPMIQAKGLKPVTADIEQDTFNIGVKSIKKRINKRTKVICATHLMGAPCDIVSVCNLADRHGIAVIEDCAHALGASVAGRKVGTFGSAAIFSLEVNKAVPTYGGGMLTTNNETIAASVSSALDRRDYSEIPALRKAVFTWAEELVIRSPLYGPLAKLLFSDKISAYFERFYRGAHDHVRTEKVAYSGFQARIGLRRLAELDNRNELMNKRWKMLASELPKAFSVQKREKVGYPAFYNFVALSSLDTSELRHKAAHAGADIGIRSEIMDNCASLLNTDDCPVGDRVFRQAVLLPFYEGLSEKRLRRLISILYELSE